MIGRMRTLLLHDLALDGDVAEALERAGHTISRCGTSPSRAFPCQGLDGHCPLDGTVDVAVVVHNGPPGMFNLAEAGVVCALRDGVPLVVAGDAADCAYREHASAIAVDAADVDAACHRAVAARDQRLSRLVGGRVEWRGDEVHAVLPPEAEPADAVRAHRALADAVPHARTIDVRVAPPAGGAGPDD
jgi:hypothetical protein